VALCDNKELFLKMLEDNQQVSEFMKTHVYVRPTEFQFETVPASGWTAFT